MDRVLRPNQKAKNGLNEIKKVLYVNIKDINNSINKMDNKITINKNEYYLRDNLNRYLQENIIIDIIHKI